MLEATMLFAALASAPGTTGAPLQVSIEVDPEPTVEIGGSPDDPRDQLFGVGRVLQTRQGGFLIVESTAGRVRMYDSTGTFLRDLGGQGDGPGEFRQILDVALAGDTLLVLDRDGSATRLGLDGSVIGTRRTDYADLTDEAFNPVPHGILADGRVLVRAQERVFGRPDGEYVRRVGWLTVDAEGRADTLAFLEAQAVRSDEGIPRPYRPWTDPAFAAGGGDLWLTVPAEGRLVRPSDGLEIEPSPGDRAPSDDDLARFREEYVARGVSANDRRVIAEWVDEAPVAERIPAFRRVVVDRIRRIWVERWPEGPARTTWHVFDSGGRRVGTVTIPLALRLEAAGPDWIVGVWSDPFGVEHVRAFSLPEPVGGSP